MQLCHKWPSATQKYFCKTFMKDSTHYMISLGNNRRMVENCVMKSCEARSHS
jgi:hypothetical protein